MDSTSGKTTFLDRIYSWLSREPENQDELLAILRTGFERNLLDADALTIVEGALQISDMQARDIMVPRSNMDVIDVNDPIDKITAFVMEASHSRFPVIGENRDDVIGILLAKDLLRMIAGLETDLRDMLRPAIFVPESKRLNVLLREFRIKRNHMALVVDEYGGIAGLVTIEDVLEQIVGDIEDEYDFDETEGNIRIDANGRYRVKATTEIEDFNAILGTNYSNEEYDTVGGMVIRQLGRLPKRGEVIQIDDLRIEVTRADSRRVHMLLIERFAEGSGDLLEGR